MATEEDTWKHLWLPTAEDDVLWRYHCSLRTKAGFSRAVALRITLVPGTRMETMKKTLVGDTLEQNCESAFWIFSKAVKNNWCEERRTPIQDMNRICNLFEEEHVSISEFHVAVQEHRHWTSCSRTWKYLASGNGASFGSRQRQN